MSRVHANRLSKAVYPKKQAIIAKQIIFKSNKLAIISHIHGTVSLSVFSPQFKGTNMRK